MLPFNPLRGAWRTWNISVCHCCNDGWSAFKVFHIPGSTSYLSECKTRFCQWEHQSRKRIIIILNLHCTTCPASSDRRCDKWQGTDSLFICLRAWIKFRWFGLAWFLNYGQWANALSRNCLIHRFSFCSAFWRDPAAAGISAVCLLGASRLW